MYLIAYIKKNGIRHAIHIFIRYKIQPLLEKIMLLFTKKRPLEDTLIIESHNDFDCNGGAFYDYLIANGYNRKYRIVWLVRKKVKKRLPPNVDTVRLYGPSIKKAYYVCTAKYFTYDCENVEKVRDGQKMVYCSHGAGGLKNVKGKLFIPDGVDFILALSEQYAPIQAEQWSIPFPNEKMVYIGYPALDTFFCGDKMDGDQSEIQKLIDRKYSKTVLWMPTFRKGGGFRRNDSSKEQKLGIPLIDSLDDYEGLNRYLAARDILLIIKIHPKQDLSNLGIKDLSNIMVLTGERVKELGVDNYRLMKCTDALISDYSSVACEYLLLDRPLAYVLDDANEYKSGFVVEDIREFMAGHEIYTLSDMEGFLDDLVSGRDVYHERRIWMRNYMHQCQDGNASKRLAGLLGMRI